MMRILLANGEEAVYRTVDELALGISSGMITAGARFFDTSSQGWRSIDAHPEYQEALARAALLVPAADLEPVPLLHQRQGDGPTPGQSRQAIYQMFSLSGAELRARRRLAWLLPVAAGAAVIAAAVTIVSVVTRRGSDVADSAQPATGPTEKPSLVEARLPEDQTVEAMRLAPVNLNSHQVYAMEAAGRHLGDSAMTLGIAGFLRPVRLVSQDSLRRTRAQLQILRALIASYHAAQRGVAMAYRDTATMLARTGFWSRVDQQEWKVFPSPAEPSAEAAEADSLLGLLEQLCTVLAAPGRTYLDAAGRIAFRDSLRAAEYDRIMTSLRRYELPPDSLRNPPPTALGLLRRLITPETAVPGTY